MKLCVFQGTFNPIHNAHIRVAEFVINHYKFDKFLFIPAAIPPHKDCDIKLSKHRLEMVKLAAEDIQGCEVSDIEFQRSGKSYTYITILELYEKYKPTDKINFLIGTDAFKKIESWYEFEKLKSLVKFIVFVREDKFNISDYDYLKEKGLDFEFQPLSYQDISSTYLRQLVKMGKSIGKYVPKKVEEYIKEYGLYKD